ncbi:hypothetical protein B9T10_04125 [Wohlfahrtiimonas chitiniclastica]|uniref:tyrosine-type recombinase/integrase n=1 Tax=Wohlfahrtiimonas chitiniclastica TaxID=400946 RepID=UPI000B98AB18|nr:site-specific integrase [Wohlfahrtiimonas chitiniclastica]OYQ90516.1 hypothetical protein B9T10_04125 [Wohlfahrtiimonas chitiniclastica]
MGSIRKRGKAYQARVKVTRDYKEINESKTFDSKLEALKWMEIRESQIRIGRSKGIDNRHTLREALERYADEVTQSKKGARWEILRIKAMLRDPNLPVDARLEHVTIDDLLNWRQQREVGSASKNRESSLLRAVFEVARMEWRWVLENPAKDLKRLKEPPPRDRRLSDHEIDLLCEEFGLDQDNPIAITQKQKTGLIFLFAIETAMRQSEITTLDWAQINLRRKFLTLLETKNGDKRDVPLSRRAIELLEVMQPKRSGEVFAITSGVVSTLFRKARDKCKIENLTFHDTRHEACTRLAEKLKVLDLARMIGHRDPRSLMIYYNATATEIAERLD